MLSYIKKHLPAALIVSMLHFLFVLLIQLENYWFHLFDSKQSIGEFFSFWFDLAIAQHDVIIGSLLFGAVFVGIAASKILRLAYVLISAIVYSHIVIDQINYKIFFNHALPSMMDEGASGFMVLLDSVVSEIDSLTVFNSFFAFVITAYIFYLLILKKGQTQLSAHFQVKFVVVLSAYFLLLLPVFHSSKQDQKLYNLNKHLYIDIVRDVFNAPQQHSAAFQHYQPVSDDELYRLKYGKDQWPKNEQLSLLASKIKNDPQKNIIFIVLESVGAEQLLPNGKFSIERTPNLYKYADNMAIFNSIYTGYPATSRSHLRMNTGGYAMTWGPIKNDIEYEYTGPTLAKEFTRLGFNTGLFSAGHLNFGNINHILKQSDYDHYFHFGIASDEFQKQTKLNSWGGDEDAFREKMQQWINQQDKNTPFFAHLLTSSTHHPYSVPKGYQGPFKGDDKKSKYYNSLHYTDMVIGRLIEDLKKQGLLENTTIAITGDHGQAFGERHSGNMTHKNYLYEENIKDFVILLDSKNIEKNITVARNGKMADILPTLVGLHSKDQLDVLGQDLLSEDYQQKLIYFHKLAAPTKWGVIDGRWKFISKLDKADPRFELYDLIDDPMEQQNLASEFSERNVEYQSQLWSWYTKANDDILQRLKGYIKDSKPVTEYNFSEPGPKNINIGYKDGSETYHKLKRVHPQQKIQAFTHWLPYGKSTVIKYDWQSPSKEHFKSNFTVKSGWDQTWVRLRAPRPIEEGTWTLNLYDGDKNVGSHQFLVSQDASLFTSQHPKAKSTQFGYKDKQGTFLENQNLSVDKALVAKTSWSHINAGKSIRYIWTNPDKKQFKQTFKVKKGWHTTWVSLKAPLPLTTGKWSLELWHEDKKLLEKPFQIVTNEPI